MIEFEESSRERIIQYLKENGTKTVNEVAEALEITKRSSAYHLNALFNKGLVDIVEFAKDKRYNLANPFDKSKKTLCRHHKPIYFEKALHRIQYIEKHGTKTLTRCEKCGYLLYPEELGNKLEL